MALGLMERFKPAPVQVVVADKDTLKMYQKIADAQGQKVKLVSPVADGTNTMLFNAKPQEVKGCHHEHGDARGTGPDVGYTELSIDEILTLADNDLQSGDKTTRTLMAAAIETATTREWRAEIAEVQKFQFNNSFLGTPNSDPRDPNLPYEGVVWHATVSSSWRTNVFSVIRFLRDPAADVSYNQVIPSHKIKVGNNLENIVYNIVDKFRVAWHAGKSFFVDPRTGERRVNFEVNKRTFGIAIDFSNKSTDSITQHQFNGMVAAVLEAKKKLGIPIDEAYHKLHLEVAPGRKFDIVKTAVLIRNVLAEAKRIEAELAGDPPVSEPDKLVGPKRIKNAAARLRTLPSTKLGKILQTLPIGTDIWVGKVVKSELDGGNVNGNPNWAGLTGGSVGPNVEASSYVHSSLVGDRPPVNRVARAQAGVFIVADFIQHQADKAVRKVAPTVEKNTAKLQDKVKSLRRAA